MARPAGGRKHPDRGGAGDSPHPLRVRRGRSARLRTFGGADESHLKVVQDFVEEATFLLRPVPRGLFTEQRQHIDGGSSSAEVDARSPGVGICRLTQADERRRCEHGEDPLKIRGTYLGGRRGAKIIPKPWVWTRHSRLFRFRRGWCGGRRRTGLPRG